MTHTPQSHVTLANFARAAGHAVSDRNRETRTGEPRDSSRWWARQARAWWRDYQHCRKVEGLS